MPAPTTTGGNMSYPATVDAGGATPWILVAEETFTQASSFTLTANTVYLYALENLGSPALVTALRMRMGATVTGQCDMGIYDGNGNLLGHTGLQTPSASSENTFTLSTAIALGQGRFMLALCPSNSTDTYVGATSFKAGAGRFCTATNAGTSGVLPSTTGTLVQATASPNMAAVVSGGAP